MSKKIWKCYFGCENDAPLHTFPHWKYPNEKKFNAWKAILDVATQNKGDNYIYRSVRICGKHFENKYISPSRRLTGTAIPTLNIVRTPTRHGQEADPKHVQPSQHLQHQVMEVPAVPLAHDVKIYELTKTQNCTSDPELNAASSNNRLKKTLKKCCLCERVENEDSSEVSLTRFPVDPEVCKQWVRNVGIAHLARKTLTYLHNNVYLCQVHFKRPQKGNSSTFEAVPTEALPYPPLPDDMLADFPIHSKVLIGLESDDHALDHERVDHIDCDDQNVTCDLDAVKSEAESEDEYNCDKGYMEDSFEAVNNPSAVDEIDSLFLSYAGTFRKLSPNLQTMLKLDIAKLFARYEMKNSTVTENEQQKGKNEKPRIAAPAPFKIKAKLAKRSSEISKSELKSNHTLKRPVASEKLVTYSAKRSKHFSTPGTHEFHKVKVCTNPEISDHQIQTNNPDIERTKTLTIDQIEVNTDQNNLSESLFVHKDFGEECEQKESDPLL